MATEATGSREEAMVRGQAVAGASAAPASGRGDETTAGQTTDQTALAAIDEILSRIDRRLAIENEAMDRLLASLARRAA